MEYSYYLIYKVRKNGGELLFNIGTRERSSTLIRLRGQRIPKLFSMMLDVLAKAGCVTPIQTGNPRIYSLRDDVGPVVGTYLVLIRRAQKIEFWIEFLDELLTGPYSRLGRAFATLLEVMIDLSRGMSPAKGYCLSPIVISSFSSALKALVKNIRR